MNKESLIFVSSIFAMILILGMTGYTLNKEMSTLSEDDLKKPFELKWYEVVGVIIVCLIIPLPIILRFD